MGANSVYCFGGCLDWMEYKTKCFHGLKARKREFWMLLVIFVDGVSSADFTIWDTDCGVFNRFLVSWRGDKKWRGWKWVVENEGIEIILKDGCERIILQYHIYIYNCSSLLTREQMEFQKLIHPKWLQFGVIIFRWIQWEFCQTKLASQGLSVHGYLLYWMQFKLVKLLLI